MIVHRTGGAVGLALSLRQNMARLAIKVRDGADREEIGIL